MRSQPVTEPPTQAGPSARSDVDVVIVAYNSRDHLRSTVEPLVDVPWLRVIVADNASPDGGLETLADLPVTKLQLAANRGFSAGCNAGWRRGGAPYVLFLNPDARIDPSSIRALVDVLERDPGVGLVGPRIVDSEGALDYSQFRFPRLRSTYSVALCLHHVVPRASWADEVVRDPGAYEAPRACEWVSGACLLMRRELLERLEGFDERFFLYCEDQDLCKRVWDAGYEVRFEPGATCLHEGGASAPATTSLAPVFFSSRLRYARKHAGRRAIALEWLALVLGALTRSLVSRGGMTARRDHLRSLATLARLPAGGETRAA